MSGGVLHSHSRGGVDRGVLSQILAGTRDKFRTSERESPNLKPKQRREKENKGWGEKRGGRKKKGRREKGPPPVHPSGMRV